ncbi:MAG: hypothetical protein ACRDO7_03920 [Nocardioidaceae bacterium]
MRFDYSLDTTASPEQARAAFIDFGPRRLEIWGSSLSPKKYELREHGDDWAVVKEGSTGFRIWVLLRYDWSEPGTVRWTLIDSGHCRRGTGCITISPGPDGGSHLEVEIAHFGPRGVTGAPTLLLQGLLGPIVFPRVWRSALNRIAEWEPGG